MDLNTLCYIMDLSVFVAIPILATIASVMLYKDGLIYTKIAVFIIVFLSLVIGGIAAVLLTQAYLNGK